MIFGQAPVATWLPRIVWKFVSSSLHLSLPVVEAIFLFSLTVCERKKRKIIIVSNHALRSNEMGKSRRDMEKEKYWRSRIEEWKQSGQPIETWCRSEGIKSCTFHWWKRELLLRDCYKVNARSSRDANQSRMIPEFTEVKVVHRTSESSFRESPDISVYAGLEVVLSGNRRIRVYRGFDVSSLYDLLRVLEYPPC
jgi:hypothetical protein